jgi:hypothetical protein
VTTIEGLAPDGRYIRCKRRSFAMTAFSAVTARPGRSCRRSRCSKRDERSPRWAPRLHSRSRPIGIKGIGEIGVVGVSAAIANAVYHATGRRIRSLPITIEQLL